MFKSSGKHVKTRLPRESRWSPLFAVEALFVALAAKREMEAASSRQSGGES